MQTVELNSAQCAVRVFLDVDFPDKTPLNPSPLTETMRKAISLQIVLLFTVLPPTADHVTGDFCKGFLPGRWLDYLFVLVPVSLCS